jgi:hypothetical protein
MKFIRKVVYLDYGTHGGNIEASFNFKRDLQKA